MAEQDLLGGYDLRKCIATGSSSQIFEVVEEGGTQPYAMKLLLQEAFEDPENVNVLRHEAKVMRTLEHPNIIRFHDIQVVKKSHAFFIMDLFNAPNVKTQIRHSLPELQVRLMKLVEQAALALGYLHDQGWVHRDIKPDNLLFTKGCEFRLIDFSLSTKAASGFAKALAKKAKTIQGTRTYIAPETIRRRPQTPQTDMYSLGATIFEILTGLPPFRSSSPKQLLLMHINEDPGEPSLLNKNVTPEMDEFVLRLLKKKPAERFEDMTEIAMAIRGLNAFKEDPMEVAAREEATTGEVYDTGGLDSRADAARTAAGIAPPPKKPKRRPNLPPTPPQPAVQQPMPGQMAPPQQPAAQMPPPGMPPQPVPPGQFPPPQVPMQHPPGQMPPPGMPAPGAIPPGMNPPPGMAPPPGMMPPPGQMPPPGMAPPPGMMPPPGAMPPPGQPAPPPVPVGTPGFNFGTPAQPGMPQRPGENPGVAPAHPGAIPAQQHPTQQPGKDDDLDFMDELPEVR